MKGKELLYFSIVSFLVVLAWMVFDVYHAITTTTITTVQQQAMKPLTPNFDHETILKILERRNP